MTDSVDEDEEGWLDLLEESLCSEQDAQIPLKSRLSNNMDKWDEVSNASGVQSQLMKRWLTEGYMPKWKGRAPARSDPNNHESAEVHSEFTDSAVSEFEAAGAVRKVSESEVGCISALGAVFRPEKKRVILDLRFVLHIHVSMSRV